MGTGLCTLYPGIVTVVSSSATTTYPLPKPKLNGIPFISFVSKLYDVPPSHLPALKYDICDTLFPFSFARIKKSVDVYGSSIELGMKSKDTIFIP